MAVLNTSEQYKSIENKKEVQSYSEHINGTIDLLWAVLNISEQYKYIRKEKYASSYSEHLNRTIDLLWGCSEHFRTVQIY